MSAFSSGPTEGWDTTGLHSSGGSRSTKMDPMCDVSVAVFMFMVVLNCWCYSQKGKVVKKYILCMCLIPFKCSLSLLPLAVCAYTTCSLSCIMLKYLAYIYSFRSDIFATASVFLPQELCLRTRGLFRKLSFHRRNQGLYLVWVFSPPALWAVLINRCRNFRVGGNSAEGLVPMKCSQCLSHQLASYPSCICGIAPECLHQSSSRLYLFFIWLQRWEDAIRGCMTGFKPWWHFSC